MGCTCSKCKNCWLAVGYEDINLKSLQVRNALLQGSVFLGWSDRLLDIANNPVHHVLLLHAPHNVGSLQLVVQPLLDLSVGRLQPSPVHSLQLQTNSFLLSSNNVFPGSSVGLTK